MFKLERRPRRIRWILLVWSAAACFPTGIARAAAVTDYIAVQPIDVCSGEQGQDSTCAPINNIIINNIPQNYKTAAVGDIGSVDVTPNGNINVARAILSQIGVDVTFLPALPDFNMSTVVQVDSCLPDGTDCQSSQFKTLSQQPAISGNPQQPYTPTAPLSPNPTTINAFFIKGLTPPPNPIGGTLFGLGWLNNNGLAVASNSLFGLGRRPDTLAHEIAHDLDLGHTTFGNLVNGSNPPVGFANNLVTAGNARVPQPDPHATIIGIGPGMGNGTNDQLLLTQQTQVLLSGFMNPIPLVNTPATGTDFNVSFVSGGRPQEMIDSLTLTAPAGVLFPLGTTVDVFNNPDSLTVASNLSNCTDAGCTSLVLDFTGNPQNPFVAGKSIGYSICEPPGEVCSPISVDDVAGGIYTYNFETDVNGTPVELFQTTSELTGPGDLVSDSQHPDLLFPSEILNPSTFVGFFAEPCTIIAPATTCPALELEDAWPPEEDQPVPEPPAVLILLSALAVLIVAYRFSSPTRPSSEAGLA
jgi:hypothetical protein